MKYFCRMFLLIMIAIQSISCSHKTTGITSPLPIWRDEFNYAGAPDSMKWNYEKGYLRNNELQYYTSRPENIRVENGNLVIEARNDSVIIDGKLVPVTSASLTTHYKASWTYGKFEIRAKIPSALGTWPAIWLLGTGIDKVDWPACGEIDIMEHVGFNPGFIHNTIHTKLYNPLLNSHKTKATPVKDPSAEFHVYAIQWSPQKIDFFIDGDLSFSFNNEGKGSETWPFDKPFFLIINFAFGGGWGGEKGVDMKALPLKYYIDYVRIYKGD